MDGMQLLIRLARKTVEERQVELGSLCRVRAEADTALAAHEQQVATEYDLAATATDCLAGFGPWIAHTARRGAELKDHSDELGRVEGAARDALRDALADSRRLELVLESAERQVRKVELRKADLRADERQMLLRMAAAP